MFSLASGAIPLLKSYLAANGLDPNKDVSLIPVGLGAQPVDALRTNKVQALIYWGSANANFENAGLKLRYLSDPNWLKIPDFSLVALQKTIDADPDMIVAIVRGVAKASLFAETNPDCARKLQWAHWPNTKPTGAPDEAAAAQWDLRSLNAIALDDAGRPMILAAASCGATSRRRTMAACRISWSTPSRFPTRAPNESLGDRRPRTSTRRSTISTMTPSSRRRKAARCL